jgi:hypothetical protein
VRKRVLALVALPALMPPITSTMYLPTLNVVRTPPPLFQLLSRVVCVSCARARACAVCGVRVRCVVVRVRVRVRTADRWLTARTRSGVCDG